MKPVLSLNEVVFKVPIKSAPILNKVSLDIFPEDFIVLLGSNGSGKSTLIKTINGLITPSSGKVLFHGRCLSPSSLNRRARSIVTLTQDLNLSTFSQLSVLENCLIALHRNKRISFVLSKRKERKLIEEHLHKFHPTLGMRLDTTVSSLSGGERQSLALAMSLWNRPELLLLDEHTSALDPPMSDNLMELTDHETKTRKITTCMTTHSLDFALRFGNRLIVMSQGSIILDVQGEEKKSLTRKQLLTYYDRT